MSAVMTPTGSSPRFCAAPSASASSSPPPRKLNMSSGLVAGPVKVRMRCGTTRPTKPMIPKKLTAAAVASDESASSRPRSFFSSMPSSAPCPSESETASIWRA